MIKFLIKLYKSVFEDSQVRYIPTEQRIGSVVRKTDISLYFINGVIRTSQPVLIAAGNLPQAAYLAGLLNLPRGKWIYIADHSQIAGTDRRVILRYGTWYTRSAEIARLTAGQWDNYVFEVKDSLNVCPQTANCRAVFSTEI